MHNLARCGGCWGDWMVGKVEAPLRLPRLAGLALLPRSDGWSAGKVGGVAGLAFLR